MSLLKQSLIIKEKTILVGKVLQKMFFSILPKNYKDSYEAFFKNKGNLVIIITCNIFIVAAYLDQGTNYLRLTFYPTLISSVALQFVLLASSYIYKYYGLSSKAFDIASFLSNLALLIFFSVIIYNTKEPRTGWWLLHFLFIFIIAQLNLFHFTLLALALLAPSLISTLYIIEQMQYSLYFMSYGYGVGIFSSLLYFYQSRLKRSEVSIQIQNIKLLKEVNDFKITKEKERISRDLHDSLGASLTSNVLYSEIARDIIDKDIAKTKDTLKKIENLSRSALVQMRDVLHPITNNSSLLNNFVSYTKDNVEQLLAVKDLSLSFNCTAEQNINNLNTTVKLNLNKIITEWLANIIKHAKASSVIVNLSVDTAIELVIEDNGIGFDKDTIIKGNGMRNLEFRVNEIHGELHILPSKSGTTLRVRAPLL